MAEAASVTCVSCGAEVPLRSAAIPYIACPYCQTLLVRDAEGLKDVGKTAVLPFDVSPIQLETWGELGGEIGGVLFTVVGRVRWGWADGSWNEWLLELKDGSVRWLGEAMGSFMVTEQRDDLLALPAIADFGRGGNVPRGTEVEIDGSVFVASDVKQAQCLGGEGQLPFPTPTDWTMTSIDFRSPDGRALSLQRDVEKPSAWLGHYCTLGELMPENLRRIEGWALPAFRPNLRA